MSENDVKKDVERRKILIVISGAMIMIPASAIGYSLFGLINGLGFVIMIGGIMFYLQTQLESAISEIEIKIKQE